MTTNAVQTLYLSGEIKASLLPYVRGKIIQGKSIWWQISGYSLYIYIYNICIQKEIASLLDLDTLQITEGLLTKFPYGRKKAWVQRQSIHIMGAFFFEMQPHQTQTIPDCKFDTETETFGGSVFNTDIETET